MSTPAYIGTTYEQTKPSVAPVLILIGFVLLSAAGVVAVPGPMRLIFPAMSGVVGLYLYFWHEATYLPFVWWLNFLTPAVRRLVDYRAGFDKSGIIMVAPLLVTLICGLDLLKKTDVDKRRETAPFLLGALVCLYGLGVAVLSSAAYVQIALYFLSWIAPILIGFFLLRRSAESPILFDKLRKTFRWGLLIIGAYSILQFVFAPAWDTSWMINAETTAFGLPEPFGIRAFSTMSAPQPLAITLVFGLLLLWGQRGLLNVLAQFVAFVALILTMARSAWIACVLGVIILVVVSRSRRAITGLIMSAIVIAGLVAGASLTPAGDTIQQRFESLNDLKSDESGAARQEGYESIFSNAVHAPFGSGIGVQDSNDTSDGEFGEYDSTATQLVLMVGWFGLVLYYGAIVLGVVLLFRGVRSNQGPVPILFTTCVCILAVSLLNSITAGAGALVLWSCLGLGLAAQMPARQTGTTDLIFENRDV